MAGMQTLEINTPDLTARFSRISSMISENFFAPWRAQPLGPTLESPKLSWANAEGIAFSQAKMPPLRLTCPGKEKRYASKYFAYIANQTSIIKIGGGSSIRLAPGELMVISDDMTSEWLMTREYLTSALIIDGELFREHVPNHSDIVARRLNFGFQLDDVLRDIMEAAWEVTQAGKFEEIGPKLVRSFLTMLSLASQPSRLPEKECACALDIRKMQIKTFIDKNFARSDLSIALIAKQLQISPRYIQMAFTSESLSPSEYLRNRRLTSCARMLGDPQFGRRSITQISFDNGFNSSAHFSTEFKRAYGLNPREYRNEARRQELSLK
jgi:AraC-like DNA-binding protein